MKKKRIRYSELGTSEPAASTKEPAAIVSEPAAVSIQQSEVSIQQSEVSRAPAATTRRRVSTPIEVARALTVARQAALEAEAAAAPPEPVVKEELVDLLMFRVGAERFAVELLGVDEVIDLPIIHFVPEMPPAMVGVVNVRGSLTPVYSPHVPLGLPLAQSEAVLIFRHAGSRVGILIDDVEDAINVDLRELRETPGNHEHDEVVLGVVRHGGALVAVADVTALIAACQSAAVLETA
ncbi:MAG: chemotaxis protein CheW [Gemmatimonadaceae bacterium]